VPKIGADVTFQREAEQDKEGYRGRGREGEGYGERKGMGGRVGERQGGGRDGKGEWEGEERRWEVEDRRLTCESSTKPKVDRP
jgi:hypothetical protein